MSNSIMYQGCPACGSGEIVKALDCRDFTVSQQLFEIWHCNSCTLRFTQNIPDEEAIVPYYQSSAYISHSDSGKGLINKLYKLARLYTIGRKRYLVHRQTGLLSGNLLDLGCGTGAFLNEMKEVGWQVTGIEPDPGARENAFKLHGIKAHAANHLYQLQTSFFDAITMWHVLEHVHDLQGYMAHLKTILKPGGKLIIAVPNYTCADADYYKEYWAAYDVPRHLYHFSPAAMKKLAEKHGYELSYLKPMWLDAFYIAMLSEQYKNGKGNMVSAVWQGWKSLVKAIQNKEKGSSIIYVLSASPTSPKEGL